ncbi:MAG TPA: hypothetical protein VKD21_08475 [Acidimicrobiales bacterium]|nr:hypothetical protein [Acidimicrobiales bacterium]
MSVSTRRFVVIGVAGAVLTFMSLASWLLVVYPDLPGSDELFHLDYAWRVGHGELPTWEEGLTAPGLEPQGPQRVFQHPPLFYALLSPAVTPLLDAGHVRGAVRAGRLVVLVIGTLTVIAVAWATGRVLPRYDPLLVVGTTAAAAVMVPLIGVSATIYNDGLAVLAATLALGIGATMVRRGPTPGRLAGLAIVCAVGFATRASFVVLLATAAVAATLAVARRFRGRGLVAGVTRGLLAASVVVAVALLAVGWFYLRNVRLTGNWTGGQPEVAEARYGRELRSPFDVATDPDVWVRGVGGIIAQPADPAVDAWRLRLAGFSAVAVLSGLALVRWVRRLARGGIDGADWLVAGLLAMATAGVAALMVVYVSIGGRAHPRYMLLATLPICLAWSLGLLLVRRARGVMLTAFVAVSVVLLLWQTSLVLQRRRFPEAGTWKAWTLGAAANGRPSLVLVALLASMAVGIGCLGVALWRLSGVEATGAQPVQPVVLSAGGTTEPPWDAPALAATGAGPADDSGPSPEPRSP